MAIWKTLEQPYAKPRTSSSFVPRRSSRMTSNRKVSRFSVQTRNFSRIWHQFAWSPANNDALVQYDEIREQNEVVHRRAYFVKQNAERIGLQKKPHFVNPQIANTMDQIPQRETPPGSTNLAPSSCSFVAMSTHSGHEFLILRNDTTEGPYALPTYLESNGNFLKVALTPFAIAGDTVLVGLVASVAAAYIYAAGTVHSYQTP